MSQKPETKFRKKIVSDLAEHIPDAVIFSIQQLAIVGTPDLLICLNGRFVALEIKSLNGKVSAMQKHNIEKINKKGSGYAVAVDPTNWKFVLERLIAMS